METTRHTVWSQWPELVVPKGFRKFSPLDFPLESSDLSEITIYIQPYMTDIELLEPVRAMSNLQLLQLPNAGYESAIAYIRPGVTLCNAQGVHNASTAELAVGLAIAMKRGFPDFIRAQAKSQWSHERRGSLNDSNIAIVGAGSIAQTLVSYLEPYEVKITTFSRSGANGSIQFDQFDHLMPSFDIIFLILPLNPESHHMFDSRRLALLKDGAILINVARGKIIDTAALVLELNSGRISAALDVTDPEPLPRDHALWSAKNVMITPHVGGDSAAFEKRGRRFMEEQLQRIADGLEPLNIIDLKSS